MFQMVYKSLCFIIKVYSYKFIILYKLYFKNIILFVKYFLIDQILKQMYNIFSLLRYIYLISFSDINALLAAYTGILQNFIMSYLYKIYFLKLILKNIFYIFPSFVIIVINLIVKNSNCFIFFLMHIFFFILKKIKRTIKSITQKTYVRSSMWIRQKIMLFLTKRQQFYFKRYYILRRARRRVNIIRRYFRLQSRYLAWNIFQHSYSLLFLLFRNIIYYTIIIPFSILDKPLLYNVKVTVKEIIVTFVNILYSLCKSIVYSLINIVFNIIPFSVNCIFNSIKYTITLNGIILNTILIKLYTMLYFIIIISINLINVIIHSIIYIIQVIILLFNIILNNIINILTIILTLMQYIIARLIEIVLIIIAIFYTLLYYIICYPIFRIYYIIYNIIYLVSLLPIFVFKHIIAIYMLILFLISSLSVLPIKHILKKIQRFIRYIYYQRQFDLIVDRYTLKYIRFTYLICYALIGIAFYGTLILIASAIKYCFKKKKIIILIICLLTLVYIYSDEKNVNELCYAITLTPEQLMYYLIDLIMSLGNDIVSLLVNFKVKFFTTESIYLFKEYLEYINKIISNILNNMCITLKLELNNLTHFCYKYLISTYNILITYISNIFPYSQFETTPLLNKISNINNYSFDFNYAVKYLLIRIELFFKCVDAYDFNFTQPKFICLNEIMLIINKFVDYDKILPDLFRWFDLDFYRNRDFHQGLFFIWAHLFN